MEIEIFTICDYAGNYNGKFVVVGTFDSIRSKSFPYVHLQCAIALRLRFADSEIGHHKVQIKLVDDTGKVLQSLDGAMEVPEPIEGIGYSACNTILNFQNMPFQLPGRYSFELIVDGEWRSGLPINVLLINNQLRAA